MAVLMFLAGTNGAAAVLDDELLRDARAFLDKGEAKAAVIQLKNLLQTSPGNAVARLMIGEAYLKLGDAPSAIKEFEKARDLNVGAEKWLVPLSQAYLLQGKPKAVLEKIQVVDSLPEKTRAEILVARGLAYTALEQAGPARESFQSALKLDAENSDALLGLGMLELRKSQFGTAIEYASRSLAKNGKNGNAWVMLGEANRLNGDRRAAIDAFATAIQLSPANIRARLGRAIAYIAQRELDDAQEDIDQARKIAGDVPLALYLHGLVAFQNKELQEAEDALIKATNLLPNHLPSLLLLGTIAYSQNRFESADNYLSRFTASVPRHLPAVKLLAATRMKQHLPARAIELLKTMEHEAQSDAQFLALMGSAYMQNKQFELGTDYLNRAAGLAPEVAAIQAQLAMSHIVSGRMEEAVDSLRHAVDLGQGLVQADMMLVLALTKQKKYDAAISAAIKMSEKMPRDPLPHNLMGTAYMAKGDVDNAKFHWHEALKIDPNYYSAGLNLAHLELQLNNLEAASERYQSVLKQNPENLAAHIGLSQIAEKRKDYPKMVEWLEKARDRNPKSLQPALSLSRYYLAQGKSLQALEIARTAASHDPDNPLALENLGVAQLHANQEASAVGTLKRLIDTAPNVPQAHHLLGQALYAVGDKREATVQWDRALTLKPDYLPAAVAKTEVALEDRNYPEAVKLARELQARHPHDSIGLQLEGDAQFAQKQFRQADRSYAKAYQSARSSALARRLFQTKRELGDSEAAFDILKNWLEDNNDDFESWLMLALLYQQTGKKKEAIEAYERTIKLMPDNLLVTNNLAWLYQEAGDPRAPELAEKILTLTDSNPEVLDTAGWILLYNGKVDRGLFILQHAAVLAPNVPQIRIHLAEALSKSGRKDDARKELSRLLSEKKDFPERSRAQALLDAM
jgi:putative PEP-CTERM system TPR-repeat lipoprotein